MLSYILMFLLWYSKLYNCNQSGPTFRIFSNDQYPRFLQNQLNVAFHIIVTVVYCHTSMLFKIIQWLDTKYTMYLPAWHETKPTSNRSPSAIVRDFSISCNKSHNVTLNYCFISQSWNTNSVNPSTSCATKKACELHPVHILSVFIVWRRSIHTSMNFSVHRRNSQESLVVALTLGLTK